jgi:hypothetical protein
VGDPAGRRRLDRFERRLIAAETGGAAAIVVAVWQVYDGWTALGVLGAAVVAICRVLDWRTRPIG